MNKTGLMFGAASVALVSGASGLRAECGEVTITMMDWASAQVVASVATFLMENGYGCQVTDMPSAANVALTSVAETGRPDILTEIWPQSTSALEPLRAAGKVTVAADVLSDGGIEGWYVPKYLVDAHPELATIEGLVAHPEMVGGIFNNCPEGWTCKTTNANLIKAAGFDSAKMKDFVHGSSETLATSLASAYEDKKPWIGYSWEPTALLGRYEMVQIDLGGYNAEGYACDKTPECANPVLSNYPKANVVTVVTNSLKDREPEVFDLMSNVTFTNEQMGAILAWKEDNNASGEEAAVFFLTTYKDVWGGWLNDAAREKLSALLQ